MSRYYYLMNRLALIFPVGARKVFFHPAGPTTIFFWAPTIKWSIVLAGIGDINRPAEQISLAQTASLMFTGLTWSRYSLVIVPKNWNLFYVNAFVGLTSTYNLYRGTVHYLETDGNPPT